MAHWGWWVGEDALGALGAAWVAGSRALGRLHGELSVAT